MNGNRQTLIEGYVLHGANYGYEIQKVLGQGAFGITYLANVKMEGALGALNSNVQVAVKEFFMKEINGREGPSVTSGRKNGIFYDYRKKFKKEAENLSKLKHPNIVKVLESFEANNTIYYVMEYFSGGNLDQRLGNQGLPISDVIRYTTQIGSAISFMHENKMLHLDIKPGNVVLDDNDNAVLIDFGLSKQYDEKGQPESSTSVGVGTPGYAPLEQANFHDDKDFPVTMDIYALGGTIYKMLTGTRPPEASVILNDGFPAQILLSACKSKEIVSFVEKAMAPMKKHRYQSVGELVTDISKCGKKESSISGKEGTMICEVPVLTDDGDWGFYETVEGEAEYGTQEIVKHKVTSHIPIPNVIKIFKSDLNNNIKIDIVLRNDKQENGQISIVNQFGERKWKKITCGIPQDVMDYLRAKGFFSPFHWELESSTLELSPDSPVSIVFEYKDGGVYSRYVSAPNHMVLRRAIEGILFNTSIGKYIAQLNHIDDFKPEDIINKEEIIYGGPPVDNSKEDLVEENKKQKDESGCLVSFSSLQAITLHCLFPAVWCLTFLNNDIPYPNLWSVGICWIAGVLLGLYIICKLNKEWIISIGLWALLIIESAVIIYLNYI